MIYRPVGMAAMIVALGAGGPARADGFENVPAGSRSAAMGGAGMARGADSAAPTLNPAGLAMIPGSVLSLSASLYQLSAVRIPHFISDDGALPSRFGALDASKSGIESMEFSAFPSGVAYFYHASSGADALVFAGSLSVPRSTSRRFVQSTEYKGESITIQESLATVLEDQSYLGALSAAWGSGDLRLGLSLLGAYTQGLRSTERSALEVQGTSGFVRDQATEIDRYSSIDAAALAGVQYDLAHWLSVGLTVRSPSLHLRGDYQGSVDFTNLGSEVDSVVAKMRSEGEAYRGLPLRLGAGVELRGEGWAVAADGLAFIPIGKPYRVVARQVVSEIGGASGTAPDDEHTLENVVPTHAIVNFALGTELQLTEEYWLRAGVFTDFTTLESAQASAERYAQMRVFPLFALPIDRFGGSAGLGTRIAGVDTTLGLRISYGAGSTLRVDPQRHFEYGVMGRAAVTDASVLDAVAFLSAALDLSEGVRQVGKHAAMGEQR